MPFIIFLAHLTLNTQSGAVSKLFVVTLAVAFVVYSLLFAIGSKGNFNFFAPMVISAAMYTLVMFITYWVLEAAPFFAHVFSFLFAGLIFEMERVLRQNPG